MAGAAAAAGAMVAEGALAQEAGAGKGSREFYQVRRYRMQTGPQTGLVDGFVRDALIPAVNRMRCSPVGAFRLEVGEGTPSLFVLIPGSSVEVLATLDLRLREDAAFLKAAEPFWSASAKEPAFVRYESSLLAAFAGWPKLTAPASKGKRMFQLRTYESPTDGAHVRKVEMFHHGEFEIFEKAGFRPVFFGDVLTGERLPKLTYMLSFADVAELMAAWDRFRTDPAWKKLSGDQRYAYEAIVSNIDNEYLAPTEYSQI